MKGSGFSKYDRRETIQSLYCYPGTDILINKEGIRRSKALARYEADISVIRIMELEKQPIRGRFGVTHLKNIRRYIFQDVYPFAGKFRQEDIWKGETFFCRIEFIQDNLIQLFNELNHENHLKGLNEEEFVNRAVHYMSVINLIHPFREGNGRAIREFIRCIAVNAGFDMDWSCVTGQKLLNAAIHAANDDFQPLKNCLTEVLIIK